MCNIAFYVTKLGKKIQILEKNAKKEPFLVTIPQKKCYITEFWNDWQKKVIIEKTQKKLEGCTLSTTYSWIDTALQTFLLHCDKEVVLLALLKDKIFTLKEIVVGEQLIESSEL